jgi:hypothetical protein
MTHMSLGFAGCHALSFINLQIVDGPMCEGFLMVHPHIRKGGVD